jgi:hypothetical protein
MNTDFFAKHEKAISVTANVSAVLTAAAGAFTFLLNISPWGIAVISFTGLLIALVALAAMKKRFSQLEKQALSVAKSYAELSISTYKESLQNRKPTFAETGYLLATLNEVKRQLGHDTSGLDDLLEELMFLESHASSNK